MPIYKTSMAANSTLLCIHRDPTQLSVLERSGYELVTATSGCEGLRLFMSRPVDAIVLDYHLGLLDGGMVAAEIKKVKPQVPIVMVAPDLELPVSALRSVDALVAKSDGPDLLLATIRSVLDVKVALPGEEKLKPSPSISRRHPNRSWDGKERRHANLGQSEAKEKSSPFSPGSRKASDSDQTQ
jgi:DNA-binding response OmpR family regulator